MRDIKFRAWHKTQGWIEDFRLTPDGTICDEMDWDCAYQETDPRRRKNIVLMQYTGLKDKNGKEIYELMEINNKFRVEYHESTASYVFTNISTGDIIPIHETNTKELEVTGEYSPLS